MMRKNTRISRRLVFSLAALLLALALPALPANAASPVKDFLIECNPNCDSVAAAINQIPGARINYIFENVPGIAATIPVDAAAALQRRGDVVEVAKDIAVAPPRPLVDQPLAADSVQALTPAEVVNVSVTAPSNYNYNNGLNGSAPLHAQGILGTNVVVAVVDSGTANNAAVVPSLAGSVIGGESLIPLAEDPLSATSTGNHPHGTWVGTMIAGHANFLFATTSTLVRSINAHAPGSAIDCSLLGCNPIASVVPMIGTAPAAKIYAIKTLPSNGGSSPASRTLAAMDRILTIRRNFDNGVPSVPTNAGCGAENNPCIYDSLPIKVVNMSLGGGTFFQGNDLKDKLTEEILEADMVLVSSAGNDGPGGLTIGSPASGRGAIDAGAASTPAHERILMDIQFGFGIGALWRPFNGIQTATFSSRGPTTDGRNGVDMTANGTASFVQSANGGITLASGTSFSSPTIAGAAALLREMFPNASAATIRAALIQSANPNVLTDGSSRLDQGKGFLDIPAAVALLNSGRRINTRLDFSIGTPFLGLNLLVAGVVPVQFHNNVSTKTVTLKPGQMSHLFVESEENTEQLIVSVTNITPALPPAQQNQLFGDDIFLTILDSYTSFAVPLVEQFLVSDSSFTIDRPTSGFVRVAVQGDSTNAGPITATVRIERVRSNLGPQTAIGKVRQGEADVISFDVPAGTSQLTGLLGWLFDWGGYPTNDLDLELVDPNGNLIPQGGTLASPERVTLDNPTPGRWTATIRGFLVQKTTFGSNADIWQLWLKADGNRLKPVHN